MLKPTLTVCWLMLLVSAVIAEEKSNTVLRFSPSGKFKIIQFADVHFDDSVGKDTESIQVKTERAIKLQNELLNDMAAIFDLEKPDLVIFTGDNVLSDPASAFALWRKLTAPMASRHIPWVAVMGNHDSESIGKSNREIMTFLETLPGSLTQCGPDDLGGGGNFVLTIKSSKTDQLQAALYCMDSGSYADKQLCDGYAWFTFSQIAWFRRQARLLTEQYNGKPISALAFFHIPLQEFNEALATGKAIGAKKENICCAKINSGMFAAMLETGSVMGMFVGHDHNNDFIASLHGIAMAYGRKSGNFSYRELETGGVRVIELNEGVRAFSTWIRTSALIEENRVDFPASFLPHQSSK